MSDERQITNLDPLSIASANVCQRDQDGHCITCSDEARPARVLSVEPESGLAIALVDETPTEIDVTLMDAVSPGDWLLVHGGVALGALEEASDVSE